MEAIRQWFENGADYYEGIKIYEEAGSNGQLKQLFASEGRTDFKEQKLREKLRELLKGTPQKIEPEAPQPPAPTFQKRWPAPDQMDPVVSALFNTWKPLFSEMNNLMARIYDVALAGEKDTARQHEAGAMAHRILDLDDMCEDIYFQRDCYLQNGQLPQLTSISETVVDPIKMPLRLENARRYVREYKNKLSKQPANVKAAAQLAKWQAEVAKYEKLLKIEK